MSIKDKIKKIPFLRNIFQHDTKSKTDSLKKNITTENPDPKLVLFEAFQGKSYSGSPKAIYEHMLNAQEFADYSFVWCFNSTDNHGDFPKNTKLVRCGSPEYFKCFANAGTWIVNSTLHESITPKNGQKYVQCWNGAPFKKIGCDVDPSENAAAEKIHAEYINEAKKITALLSQSRFCTEKLISAFDLKALGRENIIIEKGSPANSALFRFNEEYVKNIKDRLNIPENKKVVLFSPAFSAPDSTCYIEPDFENLQKNCGDDFVILLRSDISRRGLDLKKYGGYIFDASDYDDINDLYIISDILITDHSDVFFDYANLNRPMIFYLNTDEKSAAQTNDFYFGTAMLPGFTAHSQDKLEDYLNRILNDLRSGGDGLLRYKAALKAFRKRFAPYDSESCTAETIKEIFNNLYS